MSHDGIDLPKTVSLSMSAIICETVDEAGNTGMELLACIRGRYFRGKGALYQDAYYDLKSNIYHGRTA